MVTTATRTAGLPRHQLTDEQVDLLATGRHDDGALSVLCDAERSRRLLALRLLLHMARTHPLATGPLDPVDEAWGTLVRAQRTAPDVVARVLDLPQVGIWSSHTLRRLRDKADDQAPLWFHVGQLHVLAAAAAIRAGIGFRLSVPMWNGTVAIPALGSAQFRTTSEWSTADVVSDAGGSRVRTEVELVEIGSIGSTSWRPSLGTHLTSDDSALVLAIDDVGPYRGLDTPSRPEPLGAAEAARWDGLASEAWRILTHRHRRWARELSAGLTTLAPRPAAFRFRPHSASVGDGFGHAIMSVPYDAAQFAVTLVHEFQHSKLNAVEHLTSLARPDSTPECYAPWRDDPRPTGGLFHGVYAFAAVAEFWEVERHHAVGAEQDLAHFEFALLRHQLTSAVAALASRPSLTDAGKRFVAGLSARLAGWQRAEVPRHVVLAARDAAADHYAGWRANHVLPDREFVETAARAWSAGLAAPGGAPPTRVAPGPLPHRLDVKSALMRLLMADAEEFASARVRHERGEQVVDGAYEGDFALVQGDAGKAVEYYLAELSADSDRPGAWAGLGLALHATAPGLASLALRERPEVVRAVCLDVVRSTDVMPPVDEVAAWLGPA